MCLFLVSHDAEAVRSGRSLAWSVPRTDTGASEDMTDSGYPSTVREWKRGSSLNDAPVVFQGQKTEALQQRRREEAPRVGGGLKREALFANTRKPEQWEEPFLEVQGLKYLAEGQLFGKVMLHLVPGHPMAQGREFNRWLRPTGRFP